MRTRVGNPFKDQHYIIDPTYNMRVYDFIARPTEPHSVSLATEFVAPELCVFGRGTAIKERVWVKDHFENREVIMQDHDPNKQGWVNGAVWTSWRHDYVRDEPCLYIAVGLYNKACGDVRCIAGHFGYRVNQAPRLQRWQLDAIKEEIGEHPRLRLGLGPDLDKEVLSELKFIELDAPLRSEVGIR